MNDLLQVQPAGCTLTSDGMRTQGQRVARVRPAVQRVEHSEGSLRVAFAADVDVEVLRELVATERGCCSFLAVEYDERERVLTIASGDRPDVVAGFARVFGGGSR